MSNSRLDNVQVATFLNNREGNFNVLNDHRRPPFSTSIENPTDEDITIVIPAKGKCYLPNEFVNKYAEATIEFKKKKIVITLPNDANRPVFNSAKVK